MLYFETHHVHLQLGPSTIPPGLRERVLDQLSMHFQQLIQTGILSVKVRNQPLWEHTRRRDHDFPEHLLPLQPVTSWGDFSTPLDFGRKYRISLAAFEPDYTSLFQRFPARSPQLSVRMLTCCFLVS